ncbi:hypothetical protein B0H14DRAFT_2619667 [Mycena olivaceomarginata]|nr:hypothetical protein B0H14DRAFT_2619667 [Mycena olivaceomarginata]
MSAANVEILHMAQSGKHGLESELPGWLGYWPRILTDTNFTDEHRTNFRLVLSRVWEADETEANEFGEEATLVMLGRHINLLRTTVEVAFSARIQDEVVIPSQPFKDSIIGQLGEALAQAGENVKRENNTSTEDVLRSSIQGLGDLISRLATTILGELRTPQQAERATEQNIGKIHRMHGWRVFLMRPELVKHNSPKNPDGIAGDFMTELISRKSSLALNSIFSLWNSKFVSSSVRDGKEDTRSLVLRVPPEGFVDRLVGKIDDRVICAMVAIRKILDRLNPTPSLGATGWQSLEYGPVPT